MGYSSYSHNAAASLKASYAGKTRSAIFTNTSKTDPSMVPKGLKIRECRDSALHPNSIAIQFWLDLTGSMGSIPENLIKNKLDKLIETMLNHKVQDCSVMFGGIGDHISDSDPLQVGQFESGTLELDKWLKGLYLEGNGGGQQKESYLLAWLIGARHTSIDCFEKRGKKGYIFTVGDEGTHEVLKADKLKDLMGYSEASDLTAEQLLKEASQMYNIFHIHVQDGSYPNDSRIFAQWKDLLGERFLVLDDSNNVAELIATTVAVLEGADKASVISGLGSAAGSVSNALININGSTGVSTSSVIEF